MHISIELNGVHDLAILSLMLDHSKIRKMPFWMIQIAENEVFGRFLEFRTLDRLDIAYFDRTTWCSRFGLVIVVLDHSKIMKMPFWMIQIAKNEVFGNFLEFGA